MPYWSLHFYEGVNECIGRSKGLSLLVLCVCVSK